MKIKSDSNSNKKGSKDNLNGNTTANSNPLKISIKEWLFLLLTIIITHFLDKDILVTIYLALAIIFFHCFRKFKPLLLSNLSLILCVVFIVLIIIRVYPILFPPEKPDSTIYNDDKKQFMNNDLIVPSDEPTPENNCGSLPPNTMYIFAGNNCAFTNKDSSNIISINKNILVSMKRNEYGLFLTSTLYDANGIIACEIIDNKIIQNLNNHSTILKPDSHTFIVKDWHGNQLLYVKFLNPITILLLGDFYFPPNFHLSIKKDAIYAPNGVMFSGGCAGNCGIAFAF